MLKQTESKNSKKEAVTPIEGNSFKEINYQEYLAFISAFLVGATALNIPANAKFLSINENNLTIFQNSKIAQFDSEISSNDIEGKDEIRVNLKLSTHTMTVYRGEKIINSFKVGIGKDVCKLKSGITIDCKTPTGEFKVMRLTKNPDPKDPRISLPECKNGGLLGCFYVGFEERYDPNSNIADFYGAHGSPFIAESVGKSKSTGCVRMFEKDSKTLYNLVKLGTPFTVTK